MFQASSIWTIEHVLVKLTQFIGSDVMHGILQFFNWKRTLFVEMVLLVWPKVFLKKGKEENVFWKKGWIAKGVGKQLFDFARICFRTVNNGGKMLNDKQTMGLRH